MRRKKRGKGLLAPGQRYLVRVRDPEPDWEGVLRDTTDYFTMAVGLGKCLDFDHNMGRRCHCKGSCVFETALVVNRKIKPENFDGVTRKIQALEMFSGMSQL
jgi:hypothetical protein